MAEGEGAVAAITGGKEAAAVAAGVAGAAVAVAIFTPAAMDASDLALAFVE